MAEEERRRRRRGRRRGRRGSHPTGGPPEERPEGEQPEEDPEEEETPSRSRFRFGFGRGRGEGGREVGDEEEVEVEEGEEEEEERRRDDREGRPVAAAPRSVSPLSFWRRGRARTFREQPMPKRTVGRTWRRIRGLYFPPWVPVMFIIVVVFGILGLLFFARGATGAPRVNDHWHATYQVFICGQRQPNFPEWTAGVHTHADGVIHMHPFLPSEEGAGARLVKWFEYGGGKLNQTEMRMPGNQQEFKNGDTCPDGSEASLKVIVNGQELESWTRYIPNDGDRVRIEFGTGEETEAVEEDRTVIAEAEATRTVELEITDVGGNESTTAFEPASIEIRRGETVKLVVTNRGGISHSVRVAGPDREYDTSDDYVAVPTPERDIIRPGEEGSVVVRFDEEGDFEFKDPSVIPDAIGTIVVAGELDDEAPEAGTSGAGTSEAVDVTLDLEMGDNFFQPAELEVEAGQKFRIKLTNNGEFVHNFRIAGRPGPDGFDPANDLTSTPDRPKAGEDGELVDQIDEPGVYSFRDDFHPTEAVGTITVK